MNRHNLNSVEVSFSRSAQRLLRGGEKQKCNTDFGGYHSNRQSKYLGWPCLP